MKYRAEVDGLRALAVIPVIFFHAGFELFAGGFVGVDVFFVVSGYLITTILIEDIQKDRFSIVHFYERRARRILPALFLVMFVCTPLAWMWMMPGQLKDYSQSLIAVSLFSSNFLFWLESGYFALAAETKPLLHTWSLAVEEQYYVLFPIFLYFAWRLGSSRVFWMIVALAAFSLALSEWMWRTDESANFYLAPTRAWELFAGSIAAFSVQKYGVRSSNILSFAGLVAIAYATFAYDKNTPFPGVYAVVPVLGVVLLVLFAGRETLAARILSARLFVGIGLISYSAYLWHQPLFAFARINSVEEPSTLSMLLLSALSILLAYLSWKFVETPWRNREFISRGKIFLCSISGIIFFVAIGLLGHLYSDELNSGRMNPLNFEIGIAEYEMDNRKLAYESWNPLRQIAGDKNYDVEGNDADNSLWPDFAEDKINILLLGNSHSKDMFNVMKNSELVANEYSVARYGVQIRDIGEDHEFWTSPNYQAADYLMVSSRYRVEDVANLGSVIERAQSDNKKVILVKNIFEFEEYRSGEWSLIDRIVFDSLPLEISTTQLSEQVNSVYFSEFQRNATTSQVLEVNRALVKLAEKYDLTLLDRMDYICSQTEKTCHALSENLEKYFYDYGHQTLSGSEFFGRRIDELGWFQINQ